jgi:hypothetical protein
MLLLLLLLLLLLAAEKNNRQIKFVPVLLAVTTDQRIQHVLLFVA